MVKLLIFFSLGFITLILARKLILLLTKNKIYQNFLYITFFIFFILFTLTFRNSTIHDSEGNYIPPKYDGQKVIPGKVLDD